MFVFTEVRHIWGVKCNLYNAYLGVTPDDQISSMFLFDN